MSLKSIILNYIKSEYPRIIHKGEIGRKAVNEWNYENENSGRRCRELANACMIRVIYNEKHEAQYQWIPPVSIPKVEEMPQFKGTWENLDKLTIISKPKVATQTKMFPEKQGYFIG